jgi:transposase
MPADIPRRTLEGLPRKPSVDSARRRPKPPLRENRPSQERVSLLELPAYSPELDPAERWFQEFRRELSNRTFESVALMQEALSRTLLPYWKDPALLKRLTGYPWWVEAVEAL